MPYKIPASTIKASKLLCNEVLSAHGGATPVAHILDTDLQRVRNWIDQGYVPLTAVWDVAQSLKVSPWCLSYYKLVQALGEEEKYLHNVIHEANLIPAVRNKILGIYHDDKTA